MVALAFLIKEAGGERGSSRKLKEGTEPRSTDSQNGLLEPGCSGWGQGEADKRSGRLRRSIQADIIGALSTSSHSWEVGNCCARLSLAQLDTEARHCEMFSNLAHFPCLPGMSHYSSITGENHGPGSPLLSFSLLPPPPVLCRKGEEINRRKGAAPILTLEKAGKPRRPRGADIIFPYFTFPGTRKQKFNGVARFMFCL